MDTELAELLEGEAAASHYLDTAFKDNSKATIASGVKLWKLYAAMKGHPVIMPDSPRRTIILALFAAALANGDMKQHSRVSDFSFHTVKTYRYAARTYMDFHTAQAIDKRIMRGILREKGHYRRPRPVFEVHHLLSILSYWKSRGSYKDKMFSFAVVLLALSFARKSTVTATTKQMTESVARVADAWHMRREYAIAFRVRDPKGDIGKHWEAVGANVLYLSGLKDSELDIVELCVRHMHTLHEHGLAGEEMPLLQEPTPDDAPSGQPLRYVTFLREFKDAISCTCLALPWEHLGLHILRSLGPSWSKWAGNADTDTQFHGMWKSDCYKIYFRLGGDYRLRLTQRMQIWAARRAATQ